MRLTILITALDDYAEVQATIKSIRETSPANVPICVVDDGSQVPLTLLDLHAKLIRNDHRCGVGPSRHIGAINCDSDSILIIDSHMRFVPGWYEQACKLIEGHPFTAYNCACVGLSPSDMDMTRKHDEYHGATLNFYGGDRVKPNAPMQVFESCWLPQREGDDYVIPSLMGAAYLLPLDFFFHVGGLRVLKGWGTDEPLLSLKWWLAGGEIRMAKSIRIGHQFRDVASYKTEMWKPLYNKLASIYTTIPTERAWKLMNLLPNSKDLTMAKQQLEANWNEILVEKAYNQSVFKRSFEWYLSYFGLTCP